MESLQTKLEKADALIVEVEAMRDLQKRYYRASTIDKGPLLKQAKAQESKVDGLLDQYKGRGLQTTLGL